MALLLAGCICLAQSCTLEHVRLPGNGWPCGRLCALRPRPYEGSAGQAPKRQLAKRAGQRLMFRAAGSEWTMAMQVAPVWPTAARWSASGCQAAVGHAGCRGLRIRPYASCRSQAARRRLAMRAALRPLPRHFSRCGAYLHPSNAQRMLSNRQGQSFKVTDLSCDSQRV